MLHPVTQMGKAPKFGTATAKGFEIKPNAAFIGEPKPLWYQGMVATTVPKISKKTDTVINGSKGNIFSLNICNDAESWGNILKFGLNYSYLSKDDIAQFISVEQGSYEQLTNGKLLCDKILAGLTHKITPMKENVHGAFEHLTSNKGEEFKELQQWLSSNFSPSLTLSNSCDYGEMAHHLLLRIEHEPCLSVLTMGDIIQRLPLPIARLTYLLISSLAHNSNCMTSLDVLDMQRQYTGVDEFDGLALDELTTLNAMCDQELGEHLSKNKPEYIEEIISFYGDIEDCIHQVREAIEIEIALNQPWNKFSVDVKDIHTTLIDIKNTINHWGRNQNPLYGHAITQHVLQVATLTLQLSNNTSHHDFLDQGADCGIDQFRVIGFGIDVEEQCFGQFHQSICETGEIGAFAVSLDKEDPLLYINDVLLYEHALLCLCVLLDNE